MSEQCDICRTVPAESRGAIAEAFADLCATAAMTGAAGISLCVEHYGRLFWAGSAYAEVPVHG